MASFEYSSSKERLHHDGIPLGASYDHDVRPVIDLVDELRSCGLNHDIDLPSVVVVGDQSSGKSSILESLSGVELPRGTGIVTRCPLVMELKNSSQWSASVSTGKRPEDMKIINSPKALKDAIVDAQNMIAGSAKRISAQEITLRLSSPTAADITLVDLPGITRIAVEDQPEDMPQQIKDLVQSYIQRENSLILCVISGNLDIAVNESIRLATEWDPEGRRTLGVITKPDLVDSVAAKQAICNLVNGKVVDLKKGFIVVKCRPADEVGKYTLTEAIEREIKFFQTDQVYRSLDSKRTGILTLSKVLTKYLVELIKNKIPQMKKSIVELRLETQRALESIPTGPPEDCQLRKIYFINLVYKYQTQAEHCVVHGDVKYIDRQDQGNSYTLWRSFFEQFSDAINNLSNDLMIQKMTQTKFEEEIRFHQGGALTTDFITFDIIKDPVLDLLKTYIPPAQECLSHASNNIGEIMKLLTDKLFCTFPRFKTLLEDIANSVRLDQENLTTQRIIFHIKEEKAVFCQGDLLYQEMQNLEATDPINLTSGTNDEVNARKARRLLDIYLKIMNRRLADLIPCCILRVMHKEYVKMLRRRITELFSTDDFMEATLECEDISEQRYILVQKMERLLIGEKKLLSF